MKWFVTPRFAGAIAAAMMIVAPVHGQDADQAQLVALRAMDLRLAVIAQRLVTANATLCRNLQPAPGLVLHAIDQYPDSARAAVRAAFGFSAPVSVELVVPGSPAALAMRAGDGIVAIDGHDVPPPLSGKPTGATRDAANALMQSASPDRPLTLTIVRDGQRRSVTISAMAGCRSAFEVLPGPALDASSDGSIVQIGSRLFERFGDDQIAVVVAHELSHTILRHRARLEAAGVRWGLLSEFGKNARLFRRTEDDADLLGMYLLRNAGYDPGIAVAFWRGPGRALDGGFLRGGSHGSAAARAAAIAAEIARIPADTPTPYLPPILATRDQPL
ncbi:PDZ domain-containing protein [uncultured Sphingomonas sp.]|uniref:M48 family metallopeptidase n=1 Tax=uncultured Sphingomonas sp. TaxID=158754 RepID=UPI0035CC6A71